MEINISDLTWESSIYPRGGKNEKTVEAYVEALTIGAQFSPIIQYSGFDPDQLMTSPIKQSPRIDNWIFIMYASFRNPI
jgi:hypothetical protein